MKINDFTDLTRASVGQRLASLPRFRTSAILLVVLVVLLVGPSIAISSTIPTIYITSVNRDQNVSLQTYNYPPNQDFVVTMGPMGSLGINGYYVDTINSKDGGSFAVENLAIPPQLYGSTQIAIRLQSPQGYYSYNWFWNNTANVGTGGAPENSATTATSVYAGMPVNPGTPGYTGIPTIGIDSVVQDNKVTLHTHNFPANQVFKWTMGPIGTQGINGIPVVGFEAWDSGAGGDQTLTLPIPPELYGSYQISIRAQTGHPWPYPYYAYNWFYNNTTGQGGQPDPVPPDPGYSGTPTFTVCSVVQNGQASIRTNNFPPNQEFNVTMGPMGTAGIGGYHVGTIPANDGSSGDYVFNIPSELYGHYRISIRAQTAHQYPYYAYNWFYNNTADVCN